jgi:hypothetical protein
MLALYLLSSTLLLLSLACLPACLLDRLALRGILELLWEGYKRYKRRGIEKIEGGGGEGLKRNYLVYSLGRAPRVWLVHGMRALLCRLG